MMAKALLPFITTVWAFVTTVPRSLNQEAHSLESDAKACTECMAMQQAGKDAFRALDFKADPKHRLEFFKTAFVDDLVANCSRIFPDRICKRCTACVHVAVDDDVDTFMLKSNAEICSTWSDLHCGVEVQPAFEGLSSWLKQQAAHEANHVRAMDKCQE